MVAGNVAGIFLTRFPLPRLEPSREGYLEYADNIFLALRQREERHLKFLNSEILSEGIKAAKSFPSLRVLVSFK